MSRNDIGEFAVVFKTNDLHIINRKSSLDKQYIQKDIDCPEQ